MTHTLALVESPVQLLNALEWAHRYAQDTDRGVQRPLPAGGGRLPTGRAVNFCPHCGQNQTLTLCPECRSEVEPGWRHCVNCGRAVAET